MTNQAGIARGYYDATAVDTLHEWMADELSEVGAHIDDIRYCPHHPEGTVPGLSGACDCRKPETGMLVSLIEHWHPVMSRSFMLGDTDKDAQAGIAVGILGRKIEPSAILPEVESLLARDRSNR